VQDDSDPSPDPVGRLASALRERGPTDSVSQDGDQILARAVPGVERVVRALLPGAPPEQVQDLVQQTMEIAWRRLADLHEPDEPSFGAWLRGVARNVCANDRRRRRELLVADHVIDVGDPAHGVLAALQREERDQVVIAAIAAALDGMEQDVLYHRYVHGFDRARIASLLDLDGPDAVRVILQRAKRRLQAELGRRLAEMGHGPSFVRTIDPER
jgi:RNA polymerase sigma factor (sigma-70 family)